MSGSIARPTVTDVRLMVIANEQIDWLIEKLKTSREVGRLALLSVLMGLRDEINEASAADAEVKALMARVGEYPNEDWCNDAITLIGKLTGVKTRNGEW